MPEALRSYADTAGTGVERKTIMKYESLAVHGGRKGDAAIQGVNCPVYLSSTFVQKDLGNFGEFMYSRSNNPTRNNVGVLAAQLEGAEHGLAMASGMAATALAFSLLKPGGKVLINNNVYGGTWAFVSKVFSERNLQYEVITDLNNYDFSKADDSVAAVFLETPSNPLLDVVDIEAVSRRAKARGLLVIVDNTFMTSYLQKPLTLGADVVVCSATKYYGGHSDIIAGLVMINDSRLYEQLKFHQKILGAVLSPFDSFLLARGIRTLPVRMDRQMQNAQKVAEFFEASGAAEKVYYPGLPSHKGYDIQLKQARGAGALLSVSLRPEYDCAVFCRELKLFDLAVSLGGVESLICHPATMTHESYPQEMQEQIGIRDNLLRLAVGIENADDLLADIEQALAKAKKGSSC